MEVKKEIAIASTGVANIASVVAGFARLGVQSVLTSDADFFATAPLAILPGVGNFDAAIKNLRAHGFDKALTQRIKNKLPTMGICLGMQLFFEASEEAPGERGLGLLPGVIQLLKTDLPLPQLGWNEVTLTKNTLRTSYTNILSDGYAYFANSYRLCNFDAQKNNCVTTTTRYDEEFISALEQYHEDKLVLLLCQFHPELSGQWGSGLLKKFVEAAIV